MEWIKEIADLANPTAYTTRYIKNGKKAYNQVEGAITDDVIARHLDGSQPVGIYMNRDRTHSHFCVLDFDDHDGRHKDGWVLTVAMTVSSKLLSHKVPHFVVKSQSGRGAHLWIVFDQPRRNDAIREAAKQLLAAASDETEKFEVAKGGSKIEAQCPSARIEHTVEVLPKGSGMQNVALPCAFDKTIYWWENMGGWRERREMPAADFTLERHKGGKPGPKPKQVGGGIDRDAAFDAFIQRYDPDNYDDWGAAALCLQAAFGADDDWARDRWAEWSRSSPAYKPGDEKKWSKVGTPRFSPITFWLYAQAGGYSGSIPFKKAEERKLTALSFLDDVRLTMDTSRIAYAQIGERAFIPVKSEEFRLRCALALHRERGMIVSDEDTKAVVTYACAEALEAPHEEIALRFAAAGDKRYLFLADDDCTAIEIDAAGWRVCDQPPVAFRRGDGKDLPMPVEGRIDDLTALINLDEDGMCFLLAWMVSCLYAPGTPVPIALLDGPAGSGKTSALEAVVSVLDPKVGMLAALPKKEDDLLAAAYNAAVVSGDNASTLATLSDPLCRLCTGGGLRKRMLYTDFDVASMDATRPVIVSGIDPTVYAQDLIERIVRIELHRPDEYINEAEFKRRLAASRPLMLGALLTLTSQVMATVAGVETANFRFGEFARVGEAVSRIMGKDEGWFIEQYEQRLTDLAQEAADADSVLHYIAFRMAQVGCTEAKRLEFKASGLWEDMVKDVAGDAITVPRDDVPKNAQQMSSRINRAIPYLRREYGMRVSRGRRREFILEWEVNFDFDALERMYHTAQTGPTF